ncbi:Sm-like protein LSM8 (AtLSM8) (U6 snRNA-associated Sm-like protein LSM8), partial [Durusdinium trenchii]
APEEPPGAVEVIGHLFGDPPGGGRAGRAVEMAATSTGLEPLVEQQISVVTNDGRLFVGVLRGFDQSSNVVLSDCQERVFDTEKGVEQVVLGLYVIRGDNLAVVGEVDEEIDSRIDLSNIRAAPLKPVVH